MKARELGNTLHGLTTSGEIFYSLTSHSSPYKGTAQGFLLELGFTKSLMHNNGYISSGGLQGNYLRVNTP